MKFSWKLGGAALGVVGILVFGGLTAGMNEIGERTVVRHITGQQVVKFDPGIYFKLGGKAVTWPDVVDMDFDKDANPSGAHVDQPGVEVQYRDGGLGKVFGNGTFNLPNTADEMIKLQAKYKDPRGLAFRLIKPFTEETLNLTAGLVSSEDAYDSKRAIYTQMVKAQLRDGTYKTRVIQEMTKDESGKMIYKDAPVIVEVDGKPIQLAGGFQKFGITLGAFQLQRPTFEKKTMDQIEEKRKANMAIITAKANAERAKQDAITAEEKGKAAVMTERYKKLVLKEAAVVKAEQDAEVAVIKAEQLVDVAEQQKLEAIQQKLAALETEEQLKALGRGESERKRMVFEADGALQQKLDALVAINAEYAHALGQNKIVPDVMMGGTDGKSNKAVDLVDMLMVQTAKQLGVDTSVKDEEVK